MDGHLRQGSLDSGIAKRSIGASLVASHPSAQNALEWGTPRFGCADNGDGKGGLPGVA